jgi:type IV pilus assembly protein PilA
MLARMRQSAKTENDGGFTLIELLVVMIIIGILAAIAIPVFLNQRQKAQDSATKSDVSSLGKEVSTYFVDNMTVPGAAALAVNASGQYTFNGTVVGRKSQSAITISSQNYTSSTSWCVALANPNGAGTGIWKYSAVNGLQSGACTSGTDY